MYRWNVYLPKPGRRRVVHFPGWKHVALCGLALILSALQLHAQHTPRISPTGGLRCNESGPCTASTNPDTQSFLKPVIARRREMSSLESFRSASFHFECYDTESSLEGEG